ncbi:hypothetical protein BDV39DRAFT_65408 [Aspergillus sergii]|uniref:Uncharacterized protein n=1 Tax=Aspergillus sergii TaxID=1034303 RepID=A0A5N6X5Y7_9EURO|nr:hypothetical protein BDV39DRAFT_65408 [Aspergillus sergii]
MLLVIRLPRLTVIDQSEVVPMSDFQSNVTKWAEDIAAVFAQKERKVGCCLSENLFEYHSKNTCPYHDDITRFPDIIGYELCRIQNLSRTHMPGMSSWKRLCITVILSTKKAHENLIAQELPSSPQNFPRHYVLVRRPWSFPTRRQVISAFRPRIYQCRPNDGVDLQRTHAGNR